MRKCLRVGSSSLHFPVPECKRAKGKQFSCKGNFQKYMSTLHPEMANQTTRAADTGISNRETVGSC